MQHHNISEAAGQNSGVSSVIPSTPERFSLGALFIPDDVASSFSENVLQYCDAYRAERPQV